MDAQEGPMLSDSSHLENGVSASPDSMMGYMRQEIDPKKATGPLAAYCFMAGYLDAITFSAIFIWVAFQTGNFTQLGVALARLFEIRPQGVRDFTFRPPDQQALVSLLTFGFGAFLGRMGDKIGPSTRLWLVIGTLIQALFTMAAALTLWKSNSTDVAGDRGEPAWSDNLSFVCLGFISASLGLQGVVGKRLPTQFTTTLVLTTVFCEIMADPKLFRLRHAVVTRDHKVIAALSLFIGAFVARALLYEIGGPGTLGVAVGIRVLIAVSWIFIPAKKEKDQE